MHKAGEGRLAIVLNSYEVGCDKLIVITSEKGGHIGAVTIAEEQCLQTIVKHGHRDDFVSKKTAQKVRDRFGDDVAVVCGIHVDHASSAEIDLLLENAQMCVMKFLEEQR